MMIGIVYTLMGSNLLASTVVLFHILRSSRELTDESLNLYASNVSKLVWD